MQSRQRALIIHNGGGGGGMREVGGEKLLKVLRKSGRG